MAFSIDLPTRHNDTYAGTPYVHSGVLIALTEMAYAAFETHCGLSKPEHVVAMQRETRAIYRAPLHWRDGATISVCTTKATERGFTQEFSVASTTNQHQVAMFVYDWAWVDTRTGARVDLSESDREKLLAG